MLYSMLDQVHHTVWNEGTQAITYKTEMIWAYCKLYQCMVSWTRLQRVWSWEPWPQLKHWILPLENYQLFSPNASIIRHMLLLQYVIHLTESGSSSVKSLDNHWNSSF